MSALVSMLVMALVQILLRNFFDSGLLWAESFLRILVLWVAMLGAMVATRERNHISIDLVSCYLPEVGARVVSLLTNLIAAAVCGTVAWYAFVLVQFEYVDETIAFASVPSWVCQAIMPFGFAVMALRFVINGILGALGYGQD